MLSDRTLNFDDRTPGHLKDKYRTLQKKAIIEPMGSDKRGGPALKMLTTGKDETPSRLATVTTTTTKAMASPKSSIEKLPKVIELKLNMDDGRITCLMGMADVGERMVALDNVPNSLLPSFQVYRKYLREQAKMVRRAIDALEAKAEIATEIPELTTRSEVSKRSINDLSNEKPEHSTPSRPSSLSVLPLQIVDTTKDSTNSNSFVSSNLKEEPEHQAELRAKRSRIMKKIKDMRTAPERNCTIQ